MKKIFSKRKSDVLPENKEPKQKIKKKEKDLSGVQSNKLAKGTANSIVVGVSVLIVGIGLYGTYQAYTLTSKIESTDKKVVAMVNRPVPKASQAAVATNIDYPLVDRYLSKYLSIYMNVDVQKFTDREKALEKFSAFSTNENTPTKNRVLDSKTLYSVEDKGKFMLASYVVTYHVDDRQVTSLLTIPLSEMNGKFSVISEPYFTQEPSIQGQGVAMTQIDSNDDSKQVSDNEQEISKFLMVFFAKYAGSKEDDLKLLMKTPEYQGGQFELDKIDLTTIRMIYKNGKFVIQLPVSFKDLVTNFTHSENFTLTVEKRKDGTFFVDDLKHYFTEEK